MEMNEEVKHGWVLHIFFLNYRLDVRYGGKKGVRMILWSGAWATGSIEFAFTVMEKTAGGVRLWRKSQQLDTNTQR